MKNQLFIALVVALLALGVVLYLVLMPEEVAAPEDGAQMEVGQ